MKADPILDDEVIRDISDYLKVRCIRDYVMYWFAIYTGLRIQGMLQLRVRDITDGTGKLKAYVRKTNSNITIEINKNLMKILNEYVKDKPPYEYLFKSRQGANKPLTRQRAYDILSGAGKAFNMRLSPHSLRKTFARKLYELSGQDITVPMQALRHTTPEQTRRYIGVTEAVVNSYIQRLNLG